MDNLRISKYVRSYRENSDLFLFNTLNGALLYFDDIETIKDVESLLNAEIIESSCNSELVCTLKKYNFLLDQSTNEIDIAKFNFLNEYKNNRILYLTIYVTNSCNFRCVYCPQDHVPSMMKKETMCEILKSIDDILYKESYEILNISWFGGEPLLNLGVICFGMQEVLKICDKHKVKVLSGMTTNGYLLNSKVFRALIDLNVSEYQITLDGLQKAHNNNRKLINGDGTWEIIWENLLNIKKLKSEYNIALRLNSNMDNLEEIVELLDLIHTNFDERFKVRIQPIVNMGGNTDYNGFCSAMESQLIQINLYDYMRQKDYPADIVEYYISPFSIMCNCCNPNYFVIREDGGICKCELKIQDPDNLIGRVENGKLSMSQERLASFVVPNFSDQCTDCDLFPLCYGLHCPMKKKEGLLCDVKDTFLLDDYIKVAAKYLLQRAKNERI